MNKFSQPLFINLIKYILIVANQSSVLDVTVQDKLTERRRNGELPRLEKNVLDENLNFSFVNSPHTCVDLYSYNKPFIV